MNIDPTTAIQQHIERCWHRGVGIGETRLAVQRITGTKPTAADVQRAFAQLSHWAAGGQS